MTVQSFIKFYSKCNRRSDDRQTHRNTQRHTPAILLSAPCYAIAMGQIKTLTVQFDAMESSNKCDILTSISVK